MTEETEFRTIKELYERVKTENSVSYEVFRKKFHRLLQNNIRTYNRVARQLGAEPILKHHDFVAYDGEGWENKYVLLANSLGERIENPEGLSTKECLEFLNTRYKKQVKRVGFAFGYDVNHILRDVPDDQILLLLRGKSIDYEGYRISYIPSKMFVVNGIKYYDVFGFFQTNFINVVRKMLGPEYVSESLVAGKAGRGSFDQWEFEKIIEYNDEELRLLVEIMNKLRDAFLGIGIKIYEWYGPGAVAKFWFKKHNINVHEKLNEHSWKALNSAYYGGRFEQISLGTFNDVWEYDIHSAYPSVMADMPYFTEWTPVRKFVDNPYSIWHITFDLRDDFKTEYGHIKSTFCPLPVRDHEGRICFPMVGKGWYWYSEVKLVLDFFPNAKITFHKGYIAKTEDKPFAWVKDLYNYRLSLKETGNLSEYAIKVGLNSLYGKTAQKVGSNRFFSVAWAGYITSTTRAKLARAGYENGPENIIGFATDALFSTKKLNLPISTNLGDWEESHFDKGIFFQSGIYRLINGTTIQDRYRGSPLRHGIDDIIQQLTTNPEKYPEIKVGRFISHMLAIKAPEAYGKYRLQFVKVNHRLLIDAPYKRHYIGFLKEFREYGVYGGHIMPVMDYSELLKRPIPSDPKIFAGDNNVWESEDYLWGGKQIKLSDMESNLPPAKDYTLQRLLDEGTISADLNPDFDEISKLEILPVVEDEMK